MLAPRQFCAIISQLADARVSQSGQPNSCGTTDNLVRTTGALGRRHCGSL